ncbi:hypothetical protein R3P38DRAFT_2567036 [Favolaschia claudopus]|uniref:Uncharacterized protein n=1 Tax=Favolaschia claudopus TaxID=2862362 RepID=A0AAV9ZXA7_9AGAR
MARSKSLTKHAQISREERDTLMARAVVLYRLEQQKDLPPGEKRMSLRAACRKVEGAYQVDTGKLISLGHNTLRRLAQGGKSKSQSNEDKGWLLPEEVETVIAFLIELANRGFPLNHKRLKEIVDEILRARLGEKTLILVIEVFPKDYGVHKELLKAFEVADCVCQWRGGFIDI